MAPRRPILRFSEMGIPPGSELRCTRNDVSVTVFDDRRVLFKGEPMYLSPATKRALDKDSIRGPTEYWSFEGTPLWKIYNETYGERS